VNNATKERLTKLEQLFFEELTRNAIGIREGEVMTMGPAPYRRLDCDGRALAYVRRRPRKELLRIDLSGLWLTPKQTNLRIASAGAVASLAVRCEADCREAVEFIRAAVLRTRAERARREGGTENPPATLEVVPSDPGDDGETPTDEAA
jgi:hypothetical protein